MKKRARWVLTAMLALLVSAVTTGCSFRLVASPEELYSLPSLPTEYTSLSNRIQQLIASGMEYAAPVSGSNTQNVQLIDLDGDGEQEAVVFLRNSAEEQPLRIHMFTSGANGYEETGVISGSGSNIYSFNARDLNGDGALELLVGWETGMEMRALTVYSRQNGELMRTGYGKYAVADLNQDAAQELVVFRTDEQGNNIADLYVWGDGLEKTSSVRLSVTMAELNVGSIVTGTLQDGSAALFSCGVRGEVLALDLLKMTENRLENLVFSQVIGMTTEMFRYRGLMAEDINHDGITEFPAAAPLPDGSGGEHYRVDWYSYSGAGLRHAELSTYYNSLDGWYLELPQTWIGQFSVTRERVGTDEISVTFSRRDESGAPVLRICAITGSGREQRAARGNRLILSRQTDVIYTAELLAGNTGWAGTVTEEQLRRSFHLIERKWAAGDN